MALGDYRIRIHGRPHEFELRVAGKHRVLEIDPVSSAPRFTVGESLHMVAKNLTDHGKHLCRITQRDAADEMNGTRVGGLHRDTPSDRGRERKRRELVLIL